MSQAIYYVDKSGHQTTTAPTISMPVQAVPISVGAQLNKATLLKSLALACDFPDSFSYNWDSAWDCLTDSNMAHLMLDLTAVTHIDTEDFAVFTSLIEDAYQDFGKPQLWIVTPNPERAHASHPL